MDQSVIPPGAKYPSLILPGGVSGQGDNVGCDTGYFRRQFGTLPIYHDQANSEGDATCYKEVANKSSV